MSGDIEVVQEECREGKHHESSYDTFPELETDTKLFAIDSCLRKLEDFTVIDLANFADAAFYELTQISKLSSVSVCSIKSCRLDLSCWAAKFESNAQRPYFEGNERQNVTAHRREFISYFLQRKDSYYSK